MGRTLKTAKKSIGSLDEQKKRAQKEFKDAQLHKTDVPFLAEDKVCNESKKKDITLVDKKLDSNEKKRKREDSRDEKDEPPTKKVRYFIEAKPSERIPTFKATFVDGKIVSFIEVVRDKVELK